VKSCFNLLFFYYNEAGILFINYRYLHDIVHLQMVEITTFVMYSSWQ
jgi:hypothetical protein